jgi:hypothetical protein
MPQFGPLEFIIIGATVFAVAMFIRAIARLAARFVRR